MRKVKFTNGEFYHIYNRGVEKRDIFLSNSDFFRFLTAIREFSKGTQSFNLKRIILCETRSRTKSRTKSSGKKYPGQERGDADPLIRIICYCLMPNHFHFIVRQVQDSGISNFMHRLGISYTNYFNLKYKRSGVLFQGAFKAKHIEDDSYILHLSRYIHLNPLAITQISGDRKQLECYKWSSLSYYVDKNKRCLIKLDKDIILGSFQGRRAYEEFVLDLAGEKGYLPEELKMEEE